MRGKLAAVLLGAIILAVAARADDPRTRDYSAIDEWALKTSGLASSPEALAERLVRPAQDDFDKARALFRWMAANIAYDVDAFLTGIAGPATAEDTLRTGKSVCQGYSSLFERMAKTVGLEVVTISGWGKGWGYVPGQVLGQPNHAWNAVRIAGRWYLVDATWGAGYVSEARQYVPQLRNLYFLTPPEQFVTNHLPLDPAWQLLMNPVSAEDFVARVRAEPEFFGHGLGLLTHKNGVVESGLQLHMAFTAPPEVHMLAKIRAHDRDLTPEPLAGQRDDDQVGFDLEFPGPGSYDLSFYATSGDQYSTHDCVVKYRVNVTP
jgi:transglutaminase/protease-like cytokinesis protein 3